MQAGGEINRGYVEIVRNRRNPATLWKVAAVSVFRLVCLPLLFLAGMVVTAALRRKLADRRGRISDFHRSSAANVDQFLDQYPFHLYPIVCKSFELTHLRNELARLLGDETRVLEVAIGEGSFSSRIFKKSPGVVGLDLDPYMLRKARNRGHVREGVVCDCLNPAVREGSFDLLVANNFLHHVTEKRPTLKNWGRIAKVVLFNENTFYWASGWFVPYMLGKLGFRETSLQAARRIESTHLQCLLQMKDLDQLCDEVYSIRNRLTYLSERSFALCGLFSFLMKRTGPPTPPILKWVLGGRLSAVARGMTRRLAELVIYCDQFEDRSTDTFVSYTALSREFQASDGSQFLLCPGCRVPLDGGLRCSVCGTGYQSIDGMIFLLPREMDHIRSEYDKVHVAGLPSECL